MKKIFLLSFVCCFLSVSVHADISDDIYYTWQGVKMSADSGWRWVKYGTKKTIGEAASGVYKTFASSDDEKLRSYFSDADFDIVKKANCIVKLRVSEDAREVAGYNAGLHVLSINKSSLDKYSKESLMSYIHHEVVHLNDIQKLQKEGYSPAILGQLDFKTLSAPSQISLQGILEARAYSDQIKYAYLNKDTSSEMLNAYNRLVKEYPFFETFNQAIKDGETPEQASHRCATALLDSDIFINGYLKPWMQKASDSYNLHNIDIDEILSIFNDGKLTKEDIYAADNFWQNLCSYENTKDSDECLAYFARKRTKILKVCGEEKLSVQLKCAQLKGRIMQQGQIPTNEEDYWETCCNHKIVTRQTADGKEEVVTFYPMSTQIERITPYNEKGKEDGTIKFFYPNGKIKIEYNYKDGEKDGLRTEYFQNGQKKLETFFTNGKRNGLRTEYDSTGKIILQENYQNGRKIKK